jgi:hypothetical protein
MYRFIVENKKFIYGIGYIVTAPYTITNAIGVKYNNNNGTHIFMKNFEEFKDEPIEKRIEVALWRNLFWPLYGFEMIGKPIEFLSKSMAQTIYRKFD